MSVKIFSYDLETGGLKPGKNGIHQFAGRFYVDYQCVKAFKVNVQPFATDVMEPEALAVSGKTLESFKDGTHIPPEALYRAIIKTLEAHCDKFDKTSKWFLLGYNNASFDNEFFRAFFDKMNDKYFGSWFWSNSLDAMLLASQHLMMSRHTMKNFKLETVAEALGIEVDKSKLHDALGDLDLTEAIWSKCSGIELNKNIK